MARRTKPDQPPRAELTPDEMRRAVSRFQNIIARLEQFDPNVIEDRDDPRITELTTAIQTAVEKTYPTNTTQYNQYINAAMIDTAGITMMGPTPIYEVREGLQRGKADAIALIKVAIGDLQEDLADQVVAADVAPAPQNKATDKTNVFVVHGHDDAAKHEVARLIQNAGLKPIILHEQASMGKTVIEKLEKYSDVGFAIVLLTPDDVGRAQNQNELQPRARQNVIAELFYFLGKLGRTHVCALKKGNIEIPSDIGGVIYIDLDPGGAWKTELLRELDAAGYSIDWRKALR